MRKLKTLILATASVLSGPAIMAVGLSAVPQAAAAQGIPPISVGQTVNGRFDGTEPLFDDQYPLRGYELQLRRGETVTISVTSRTLTIVPVILGDNDFSALPEDSSPNSVTFTAPTAGTYTVALTAMERAQGSFTLSVQGAGRSVQPSPPPRPAPPPPAVRPSPPPPPAARAAPTPARGQATTTIDITGNWTRADDQLDDGNRVDLYTFELRRGDRVRVDTDAGSQEQLTGVTGPSDFSRFSDGESSRVTIDFTVPEAGTYNFAITPMDPGALGAYRLIITITGN